MSLKYTIIKSLFHIIPIQNIMAKPYDELLKTFHTAQATPSIPQLKDAELTFETHSVEHFPAEKIAFLGGSSGAAMVLWLMSYINMQGEDVPMPGKIALSSPGSALTTEERKRAEELNKTDLIMSTTALDNIFKGMVGEKKLPDALLYTSKGIYDGIKDVYLSYGADEVFSAAAQSTAQQLKSYGANVTLEIAEGMYHTYAVMPLVKEAKPGHERLVAYLTVETHTEPPLMV